VNSTENQSTYCGNCDCFINKDCKLEGVGWCDLFYFPVLYYNTCDEYLPKNDERKNENIYK